LAPGFFISRDNGQTTKGPFPLDQIRSMYLNNRIPTDIQIKSANSDKWESLSYLEPDLARQRAAFHEQISAEIEYSDKVAIREERSAIWKGLVFFILGSVVTVLTYNAAAENPSGGTIFIAYGPVFSGFVAFMYGLVSTIQRKRAKSREARSKAETSTPAFH